MQYSTNSGLTPDVERAEVSARVRMLMNAPFFGTLSARLILKKHAILKTPFHILKGIILDYFTFLKLNSIHALEY